jgi:hypothetical protein
MNSKTSKEERALERARRFENQPFQLGAGFADSSNLIAPETARRLLEEFWPIHELSCLAFGVPLENAVEKNAGKVGEGRPEE